MGAYWLKYIGTDHSAQLKVEQGQEIDREALIGVDVENREGEYHVTIEGTAVFVKEMTISLPA
jgi:predicted PhzF superfamily epimerase YddE/YHI9